MKKKFKQSYKLGIAAGIMAAIADSFWTSILFVLMPLEQLQLLSWPSLFFLISLSSMILMILISAIFIRTINILPSNKIPIKFFILYSTIFTIFLPLSLFTYRNTITFFIISSILTLILVPLFFSLFYILLAKKTKIAKITNAKFTILVLAILFIFFILTSVFMTVSIIKKLPELGIGVDINETEVEKEIFTLVNQERQKQGNNPLIWDSGLYAVAKDYSSQLASQNATFSHISETGQTFYDRIKQKNLFFFVAGENLYRAPKTDNFSKFVFDGWMESPGHRSVVVDRDKFFTNGAVGVECTSMVCYVALNVVDFEEHYEHTLNEYHYFYRNLNDAGLGLGNTYPVSITVEADNPVDILFFNSMDHVKLFVDYGEDKAYKRILNTKKFSTDTQAKKDAFIVIINTNPSSAAFEYTAVYN